MVDESRSRTGAGDRGITNDHFPAIMCFHVELGIARPQGVSCIADNVFLTQSMVSGCEANYQVMTHKWASKDK